MFAGEKKNRNFDYGLGFDFALNRVPIYSHESYHNYLKQNGFIQYGISVIINYNFRRRLATK